MPPTTNYEIPPFGTTGDRLLGWLLEAVDEGEAWLGAQNPKRDWDKVLEILGPSAGQDALAGQSSTEYNKAERIFREQVASLSSFRHEGEFKPRFDMKLYQHAHALTKLDRNWYEETHGYDVHRAAIQAAAALGTGYLYEVWDKTFWKTHGDIRLMAVMPQDVTFIQLPRDHDIQRAYAVIIREEMPINLAKATYQNIAHHLEPDRDKPGWLAKGLQRLQRLMGGSPALRTAGTSARQQQGSFPTVDVFHMYVLDRSINQGPTSVSMGVRGTNWTYQVPALGDPIPTGVINPSTGESWTRPAEADDCKLFPLRRYCIFTRTAVAYDGSSPWWHGDVPLARFRFNDLAWEALGKSLIGNITSMQAGITAIMRYIEDACAARLDPALLYDDQALSEGFIKSFNPRKAGTRAAVSLSMNPDVIKTALPYQHYDVPTFIPEFIKAQEGRMDYLTATPDLVAIAKAKQVPGEGTLEKIMDMAGPLVQDMYNGLSMPLHQLGEWRKAYYFQFYTHGRVIETVGEDGEAQDEQYSPDLLVPPIDGENVNAKIERARRLMSQYKFRLTESGAHEMHRMMNRLALLQLQKAGVPIDWWTIAKAWKIANFGPEPEGTHNVIERFVAQLHLQRELAEEAGGGMPGGDQRGRPPSGKKPPQIVSKDHGTRSTIKTS